MKNTKAKTKRDAMVQALEAFIATCARHHKVSVESADAHFTFLMKL